MNPWEQEFMGSRGTVSAISLVSFIVFALSQLLIGRLIDKRSKILYLRRDYVDLCNSDDWNNIRFNDKSGH
jgi:hypothetical protein